MRWFCGSSVVIFGQFSVSSKKLKFFLFKNWVWPIGFFPIVISVLVAFNQYQYQYKLSQLMHTVRETSKSPRADVYMLTNVTACCAFCDGGHATIGLANLANYPVQRFLHSLILFRVLDPTKYHTMHTFVIFVRTAMLDPNQWQSQLSWIVGAVKSYTERY